jgi:lipid-A-disaccharide synthase
MEAAGQRPIVRAEDVAVMGITEILRHIPRIVAAYRTLVRALHRERPALAILIDFPDVNFRLAKHCKRLDIPVLWLVSPQLWAWKRSRLRWVQQRVSKMLVIFPFEAAFYRARNVDAEFIGHPLASLPVPHITRSQFAVRHMAANPDNPESSSHMQRSWIAILPGSRWKEVVATLPAMLEAAALLGPGYDFLIPVASTLDKAQFSDLVFKTIYPTLNWPHSSITLVPDARAALHHSRAAIIASGTATVQALTLGIPFVVVYKVSRLTYTLAKRLIRYPPEVWPQPEPSEQDLPIAMPNLIAGRRIVPELLNDNFTASKVAAALKPLLTDTPERTQMLADLAETRARLLAPGTKTPIERAADATIELL